MLFDIHSHILPKVDDGSDSLETSVKLLEMMKAQGITDVLATPHFYPSEMNLERFETKIEKAYLALKQEVKDKDLPRIYLGCELLYFKGLGTVSSLEQFCLNNSEYMLLELTDGNIGSTLFKDLDMIINHWGITPIIAHIERYFKAKEYKNLIKYVKKENLPIQLNTESVTSSYYGKAVKKLLKDNLFIVLGTDTHSVEHRPPLMDKALSHITQNYGIRPTNRLLSNSEQLFKEITAND